MKKLTVKLSKFHRAEVMQGLEIMGIEGRYETKPQQITIGMGKGSFFGEREITLPKWSYPKLCVNEYVDDCSYRYDEYIASFKDLARILGLEFRQEGELIFLEEKAVIKF
jgi:hypothetical protein